ncbi:18116_t:CDS:2 [Dentiscutata erythropus]|uniref:18116_t:CDS:1 n=1 Tax=Dentiscutata erythropus TaxID=1348616 RepID=A0A9N8WBI6_9GLOM|nr:18116_t:CDS:2 [Dentiscutata erythropus]
MQQQNYKYQPKRSDYTRKRSYQDTTSLETNKIVAKINPIANLNNKR